MKYKVTGNPILSPIFANQQAASFAGVAGGLSNPIPTGQGEGNPQQQQNPMNPHQTPVPSVDPNASKMYPGQQTNHRQDPNSAGNNNPPAQQSEGRSLLDNYANLFDNGNQDKSTTSNKEQQQQQQPKPAQKSRSPFDYNFDDFHKAAENLNFSNVITDDAKQALAKGGEDAVKALDGILTSFGRQLYAQAAATNTRLTKSGFDQYKKDLEGDVNRTVKLNSLRDSTITESNKQILQHPAVKPLVGAVQRQILDRHPEASTQELQEMTVNYFRELSKGFAEPSKEKTKEAQEEEDSANWADFFK